MPRPSSLKSTVAILRTELELTQPEFAKLAQCSPATIQSIELGRLALSEKLAMRISEETGVSMSWLLAGKIQRPIPAAESRESAFVEYGRRHFDAAQSRGLPAIADGDLQGLLEMHRQNLTAVFRAAKKNSTAELQRCYHRISSGLDKLSTELKKEFGEDLDYQFSTYEKQVRAIPSSAAEHNEIEIQPWVPSDEDLENRGLPNPDSSDPT